MMSSWCCAAMPPRRSPTACSIRSTACSICRTPERTMRYVDARRRVEKAARIEDGIVQSVCLAGETAAQEWLKNMMVQGASADAMRSWILAPVAAPPRGSFNRGAHRVQLLRRIRGRNKRGARGRRGSGATAEPSQVRHRMRLVPAGTEAHVRKARISGRAGQDSGFGERSNRSLSSGSSAELRITNH